MNLLRKPEKAVLFITPVTQKLQGTINTDKTNKRLCLRISCCQPGINYLLLHIEFIHGGCSQSHLLSLDNQRVCSKFLMDVKI